MGGGQGTLLEEVVAAFPSLSGKATVVDRPSVVKSAPERDGVRFVGADFFDATTIPTVNANCYIEKVVLHDWSDEKVVEIVSTALAALKKGGVERGEQRLFLAEQVLRAGDSLEVPKIGLDMHMMVMCGGGERTEGEWAVLMEKAGWVLLNTYDTRSLFSLMEFVPM